MSNLADYVNAIKIGKNVICIEDVSKRDDMAEVEIINKTWLHDSGVVIRYSRENELVKYSSNACPECSIRWHVVDAAGQDIRPLEKTFHNACRVVLVKSKSSNASPGVNAGLTNHSDTKPLHEQRCPVVV